MAVVVSPEIWKNWEKSGKSEFMKQCIPILKETSKSPVFDKGSKNVIGNYITILVNKGIHGVINKEAVITTLHELAALHSDVPAVICDALNIADAETSVFDNHEESKERHIFSYIVKECEKFVSDKLLKERLEIDTLQEVGVLKNRSFYTKFIKIKTKLYYKQRKFNLFREESEGYAKLVTELNQEFGTSITEKGLLDIVKSLIGCFNLDPNRVLDLILESFENKPNDAALFIPLVRSYMNDKKIIAEVLGSKYTFMRRNTDVEPTSLYLVTAILLQHGIISLDDIYLWLTPEDKVMQKDWDTELKNAKEYVRKSQVLNLNSTKAEEPEEKDSFVDKYNFNHKLGVCEALLNVGDWTNAQLIINRLPEHFALDYEPIAVALCKLLQYIVEPVYRENCKLGKKIKSNPILPHTSALAPKPATTFIELRENAIPMLIALGPSLRFDSVLLYKVIRLAREALASYGVDSAQSKPPSGDHLYYDILSILDKTILPSLSYLDCNCCVAEEIWNILKLYPYQIRYCLYSRWKNETYLLYPDLLRKRADAEKQIKNIMKRVSKENVKPVGRSIGKLTHSAPGILFDYMLVQIQVYDNLILPVVDSLKYLTSLSYDVLGFCLVETLSSSDKNRVKHDTTSISNWLQSLSSFCGAVFKKYNIELSGLLQYVANQLKVQKSSDLLILKEIVQKMAGIESAEDLTIEQLNAMAGSELLKTEAGSFSQIRNTKKSSFRLREALSDQNLAVTLCLLMAQQKYCVVYRETQKSHLKLVGNLSDQCQDTLVQFGTFLGSTLSVDEYSNRLPSIQSMLLDYHIPNEIAFFLARPMFNHSISIKYDQIRKDAGFKKLSIEKKHAKYFEVVQEIMEPIHKSVVPLHPAKVWEDISPQFLSTFWSLTMFDLYVPDETYDQVMGKLKQQALAVTESNTSKGKKELERYTTMIEKLNDERKKQKEHVEKVMYRLNQEKDNWFLVKYAKVAKNETITRFLQLCLFPRCTFTQTDALYCAKFVHVIHTLKATNFATLLCYDRIFCDVTYSITSCTENEAMRYGRFLCAMLETVMRWQKSKEVFEKECASYPGFVTKFRVSNQYCENLEEVGFENYRHVCHKWHFKLAKAMVVCLDSKEFVQIRNALIVLIKIIPHFPVLMKLCQIIEKKIEKVRDEEKIRRQDLYTLAISYQGLLKQRISAGFMQRESDFHVVVEKEKTVKTHDVIKMDLSVTKHNGDTVKESSNFSKDVLKDVKDKQDNKRSRQNNDDGRSSQKVQVQQGLSEMSIIKDKVGDKEKTPKEEKHIKKEEKREEIDRERDKRREKKEDKLLLKEDRSYRQDDRYVEMVSSKDDVRFSGERDRYYDERTASHYYREVHADREISANNSGITLRRSQEPLEPERVDAKRRKLEGSSSKNSKHEERKMQLQIDYFGDKVEKKERPSKVKEKREKVTDEEKELRKERKVGRKRDRAEEAVLQAERKRIREEEKNAKITAHQNGEQMESPHVREKHHHTREKSPYLRDRSHDRMELREKPYAFHRHKYS